MSDPVTKLLDSIERLKAEIKLKDVLISEMYLQHVEERQQMKKEFFVERRLMEQKHEEETVRIESDMLRIKAEMDTLERQLTGLMSRNDTTGSSSNYKPKTQDKDSPPGLSLPCPRCQVCDDLMMPPVHIYQCSSGHFVCEHCHSKLHVTVCRTCMGEYVGRATGMETYLDTLFGQHSSS